MAPSAITEDYYMILEVEQTAGLELIMKSYKRLALKLHPDRNSKRDATEAFQRLGRAYETLKNESERRKYDLIYPSLKGRTASPQYARERPTNSASSSHTGTGSEAVQIAALRKSKQERAARWWTSKTAFEASIFEAERAIKRLEQEINGLLSILAAEAAEKAQKNSWGAWMLSPIFKRAEDSDEMKAQKDRARQERRIEKDMKERRLEAKKATLRTNKTSMESSKAEIDAANARDDAIIQELLNRIWRKESHQRQEREKAEREKRAQQMRQQQEQRERNEREAAEVRKRKEAAERLAAQQRQEEAARRWQKVVEEFEKQKAEFKKQQGHATFTKSTKSNGLKTDTAGCRHDGWWPKVQGRVACPRCNETWTYLLQCPGCAMKACPKCQAAVRPRRPRNAARPDRSSRPRVRTPSPSFGYDDYY